MLALAVLLPLTACKKKEAAAPPPEPKPAMGSGSAAMAGSGSAAAMKPPEPAKPATPEDEAKRYVECWGFFTAHDADKFKTCYTKDASSVHEDSGMPDATGADQIIETHAKPFWTAFPDIKGDVELTLINGKNGVTVALLTGTNSGTMKTPMGDMPATNKKIGMQVAHAAHFADDGKAVDKERFYADMGEMMGQLGVSKAPVRPAADKPSMANEIVIAKDDETEKKNLAMSQAGVDSFNKHDIKALEASLADDATWSEIGVPKDWNKKEAVKMHEELFKAFPDLKITLDTSWAAGDYVVWEGTFAGTNKGPAPDMGIAKATNKPVSLKFMQVMKIKDGKIKNSWGFWNSMKFAMDLGMAPPPPAAGDKKPADDKKPAAGDKKPADDKKPAKK